MDVGRQGKKTLTSQIVRLLEYIHKVLPEISFFVIATKQRTPYYCVPVFIFQKSPFFWKFVTLQEDDRDNKKTTTELKNEYYYFEFWTRGV